MSKFHGAKEYLLDHLLCKALQDKLPCLTAYIIRSFLPSKRDIASLVFYDFAVVNALVLCDFRAFLALVSGTEGVLGSEKYNQHLCEGIVCASLFDEADVIRECHDRMTRSLSSDEALLPMIIATARSNVGCLLLIQSFPRAGDARMALDFAYRAAIVNGCAPVVEAMRTAGLASPYWVDTEVSRELTRKPDFRNRISDLGRLDLTSRSLLPQFRREFLGYIVHSVRMYDTDDMILWMVVDI